MSGLAEALRAMLACPGIDSTSQEHGETFRDIAHAALAAHDAAVQAGGWSVSRDAWPRIIGEDGESVIAKTYTQDGTHADRIVACVNACQGIADPALFVAAADALRSAAVDTEDDPDLDAAKAQYDSAREALS